MCEKVKISIYQLLGFQIPTTGCKRGATAAPVSCNIINAFAMDSIIGRRACLSCCAHNVCLQHHIYALHHQKSGTFPIW